MVQYNRFSQKLFFRVDISYGTIDVMATATQTKEKLAPAFEMVFNEIVKMMQDGIIPWHQDWSTFRPYNGASKHRYRGINILLLAYKGFQDARWYTYDQASKVGGQVQKGAKSCKIVFWTMFEPKDAKPGPDGKKPMIPCLRYFSVFNAEQVDGIESDDTKAILSDPQKIVDGFTTGPKIVHSSDIAGYSNTQDTVYMPSIGQFESPGRYYATMFHELAHATGHKTRLDRLKGDTFGDQKYTFEELVAELTAAFVCAECGIDNTLERSAGYLQHWLKFVIDNPKAIIQASAQAQKAADYILTNGASAKTKDSE